MPMSLAHGISYVLLVILTAIQQNEMGSDWMMYVPVVHWTANKKQMK